MTDDKLAIAGKKKRIDNENKKLLLSLAKEIKFESKIFPNEFLHNSKEPLRYKLWQCELLIWLNSKGFLCNIPVNLDSLEYDLINNINVYSHQIKLTN